MPAAACVVAPAAASPACGVPVGIEGASAEHARAEDEHENQCEDEAAAQGGHTSS